MSVDLDKLREMTLRHTEKKPFQPKKATWEQVPLFANSEIHDKHGKYGKPEVTQ